MRSVRYALCLLWIASCPVAQLHAQAGTGTQAVPTSSGPANGSSTFAGAPPLAESLSGQAKVDYDAARMLFDDGDFGGALVKFQRAFEQAGDVRLLWNMAVCEKSLRHYAAVQRLLERYRREGDARMTQAHRAEVSEVMTTIASLISKVRVSVNEADAELFVDDQPAGRTPLAEPLLVDLGKRRIRVSKPGFADQLVVQDFAGGSEVTLGITLQAQAQRSQLAVIAQAGSTIRIDGEIVGQDSYDGTLPAGSHTLRVTAEGKLPHERQLTLRANESRVLHVALRDDEGGVPALVWIGAGVAVASGLAVGGYFLLREPEPAEAKPQVGTLSPGVVVLP
jgi:hypothetical protein